MTMKDLTTIQVDSLIEKKVTVTVRIKKITQLIKKVFTKKDKP